MKLAIFSALLLGSIGFASAQQLTNTCTEWFEPKTFQDAIAASPDPKNNRPAVIFGDTVAVPVMRFRFVDGASGQPIRSQALTVNYGWRWLEYPYPEHPLGAWSKTSDQLSCSTDENGWIEAPEHLVKPRGWYKGVYTSIPWPKRPSFTGIGAVATTKVGSARVNVSPEDVKKFKSSVLIVRVYDGWRTELSWVTQRSARYLTRYRLTTSNPDFRDRWL
ncbi:MAG TPA: hypothetical protein VN622_04970 [Clostridia bacterium]|nr:hypothetical protein [Clostridia bacterium]